MIDQGLPPTPGPAYPPGGRLPVGGSDREVEFAQARSDGDPGEPGGLGDPGDPTPPDRPGFGGGPEPTSPLIEHGLEAGVLRLDGLHGGVPHTHHRSNPDLESASLLWRDSLENLQVLEGMRPGRGGTAGPASGPPDAAPTRPAAAARLPGPTASGPRPAPRPAAASPTPPAAAPTRAPPAPARPPSGRCTAARGTGAPRRTAPGRCPSAAGPPRRSSGTAPASSSASPSGSAPTPRPGPRPASACRAIAPSRPR